MKLGILANNKICRHLDKQLATEIRIEPIGISISINSGQGNNQMRTIQRNLADIKHNRLQISISIRCHNRKLTRAGQLR